MTESLWFIVSLLVVYVLIGAVVSTVFVTTEVHNDREHWRDEWGPRPTKWAYGYLWVSAFLLWPIVVIPRN